VRRPIEREAGAPLEASPGSGPAWSSPAVERRTRSRMLQAGPGAPAGDRGGLCSAVSLTSIERSATGGGLATSVAATGGVLSTLVSAACTIRYGTATSRGLPAAATAGECWDRGAISGGGGDSNPSVRQSRTTVF